MSCKKQGYPIVLGAPVDKARIRGTVDTNLHTNLAKPRRFDVDISMYKQLLLWDAAGVPRFESLFLYYGCEFFGAKLARTVQDGLGSRTG